MKVFIFIALYVLITFVTSLLFIVKDYKYKMVYCKDVDEYIEYNIVNIVLFFILASVWPISGTVALFIWSMHTVIKFVLGKVNKED